MCGSHVLAARFVLQNAIDSELQPRFSEKRHKKLISKRRSGIGPAAVVALQPRNRRAARAAMKRHHFAQGETEQIRRLAKLHISRSVASDWLGSVRVLKESRGGRV